LSAILEIMKFTISTMNCARKTNEVSFSTNFGIANSLVWLFYGLESSLACNAEMATVHHFEQIVVNKTCNTKVPDKPERQQTFMIHFNF